MISSSAERSSVLRTCSTLSMMEFSSSMSPLEDRETLQNHDRGIADLKRQVCNSRLHCSSAYTTSHRSVLLARKSALHSAGFGIYIVTTLTLSPSRSVAICAWKISGSWGTLHSRKSDYSTAGRKPLPGRRYASGSDPPFFPNEPNPVTNRPAFPRKQNLMSPNPLRSRSQSLQYVYYHRVKPT